MERSRGRGRGSGRRSLRGGSGAGGRGGRGFTPQGRGSSTSRSRGNTPTSRGSKPRGRPALRGDAAKNTSPQSSQSPAQKSTLSPLAQRRNVTDLGIRRSSPARVSPSGSRGRSPVRATRASAGVSPATGRGQSPATAQGSGSTRGQSPAAGRAVGRSTRADSRSPIAQGKEDEMRGRNPVRADAKKNVSPVVTRNSPRPQVLSPPTTRSSPRAKLISPAPAAKSVKMSTSPRASPRAAVKKPSPNRSKVTDSSKSDRGLEERKRSGYQSVEQPEDCEEEETSGRTLRKTNPQMKKTTLETQPKTAAKVTSAQAGSKKALTIKRTESGANDSESASGAPSPTPSPAPSEKSSVYDFDTTHPEDSVSPGYRKYRSPEKKLGETSKTTAKPKAVDSAGGAMVTLEDGTDVTLSLRTLPPGTVLNVRRSVDGEILVCQWNGEKMSSINKEIDSDLKQTSPRPTSSKSQETEYELQDESISPAAHPGCGRRGTSRTYDKNVITAERRIHIALVAAAMIQARLEAARNKRRPGRPSLKATLNSGNDPWAGTLSPSAKQFSMFNSPKFSSPKSVLSPRSIRWEISSDDKSSKVGKTKAEESSDLEVQIVPKFSVSRTFRSPSHAESDEDSSSMGQRKRRRGRPRKSYPVLDRNKVITTDSEVVIAPKSLPLKKVTIIDSGGAQVVKCANASMGAKDRDDSSAEKDSQDVSVAVDVKGADSTTLTGSATLTGAAKSTGGHKSLPDEAKDKIRIRDKRSLPTDTKTVQEKPKSAGNQNQGRKVLMTKRMGMRGSSREKSMSPGLMGKQANKATKLNDGSRPSGKLMKSKVFREATGKDSSSFIREVEPGHKAVTVHRVIPAHLLKPVSLVGVKVSSRNIKVTPSKVVLTKLEVSPEEALNRLLVIEALLKAQKGVKKGAGARGSGRKGTRGGRLPKVKQEKIKEQPETLTKLEEWQLMLAQHVLPMRKSDVTTSQTQDDSPSSDSPTDSNTEKELKKQLAPPAKRGRRLRTESWTISEDKALHAATAVADVILIPDQDGVKEQTLKIEAQGEKLKIDSNGDKLKSKAQEVEPSLGSKSEIQRSHEAKIAGGATELVTKNTIEAPVTIALLTGSKPTPVILAENKPVISKPETVLAKPGSADQKESSKSSTSESFDSSCENLNLVLEGEESGESEGDTKNHGSKSTGIPNSDSMPELSKIGEPPSATQDQADLGVPQLSPVKDIVGKSSGSYYQEKSGKPELSDSQCKTTETQKGESEKAKDEEIVDIEAVNSQLMSDLTKSGAPIHNDVVVLAAWSVSSEDDTELDVTGTTMDSTEGGTTDKIVTSGATGKIVKDSIASKNTKDTDASEKNMKGDASGKIKSSDRDGSGSSTDGTKVSPEEIQDGRTSGEDFTLVEFQKRLDTVLKKHINVKDIDDVIIDDVREQIDDIVTAVELNESRDEELSRSREASPVKGSPIKGSSIKGAGGSGTKGGASGGTVERMQGKIDDAAQKKKQVIGNNIQTGMENKNLHEGDKASLKEDKSSSDGDSSKKEPTKILSSSRRDSYDDIEDTVLEQLEDIISAVELSESNTGDGESQSVDQTRRRTVSKESSEDSEKVDLYSQGSLESGGFDVGSTDSPHIPLGLIGEGSKTEGLTGVEGPGPGGLRYSPTEVARPEAEEAEGGDGAQADGPGADNKIGKSIMVKSAPSGKSQKIAKDTESAKGDEITDNDSGNRNTALEKDSKQKKLETEGKVWMHVRAPKDEANETDKNNGKSIIMMDCSREFKEAFGEQERKADGKSQVGLDAKRSVKTPEPGVLSVRKRRELNRLKTDMVGAENVFVAVSGDEDGGEGSMQRRTRRGKRQRSPVTPGVSTPGQGLTKEGEVKRARSESRSRSLTRSVSPSAHSTSPKASEIKRRVPTLARLAKTALPPGTNVKDIPKIEPPHKLKGKTKKRRSPWTMPTKRRSRGGKTVTPSRRHHEIVEAQSEEDDLTENEGDVSQESVTAPVLRQQSLVKRIRVSPSRPRHSPPKVRQMVEGLKEGSVEPEIAQLDTTGSHSYGNAANRPPSKYHIPSPTRMKTRGKRTNVLSMVQDYLEFSPERELPPVKPKTAHFTEQYKTAALEAVRVVEMLPDADEVSDVDDENYSDRVISGTLQELEIYCKPCSVVAVDFIRCLDLEQLKKSPGSSSPGSARANRVVSPGYSGSQFGSARKQSGSTGTQSGATAATYHMDSSTEDDEESTAHTVEVKKSAKASPKRHQSNGKDGKDTSLSPEKATTPYEAQFLSFLNKPDKRVTSAPVPVAAKSESVESGRHPQQPKPSEPAVQDSTDNQAQSKGRFCCKHCTYSSNIRSVMQEHIYNHTPVVPYSCGYCSAIFGTKNGVKLHSKREHKNSPPLVIKTTEVKEENMYYERPPTPTTTATTPAPSGVKRKAESSPAAVAPPALKRKPTARKSVVRNNSNHGNSIVASLLQAPPAAMRDSPTPSPIPSTGSLKMKFSLGGDKKEAILMSGPSSSAGEETKKTNKVTPRPRIPELETVDPNRPYYQCRHCTFATHNLPYIENHVGEKHPSDQRYVCPLCDMVYCKFEDAEGMRKHFQKYHPGQPVMLIMEPLFYDVHTKDGEGVTHTTGTAKEVNKRKNTDKAAAAARSSPTGALEIDLPEEFDQPKSDGKRTVSPLILKVPSVGGPRAKGAVPPKSGNIPPKASATHKVGVPKARKQIVSNRALTASKTETEKKALTKKSPSPSDYMCKEISSTSGENLENDPPRVDSAGSGDSSETSQSSIPRSTPSAQANTGASVQPEASPGLQIVSVCSLAPENDVTRPPGGPDVAEEFVEKVVYECKRCGKLLESLDTAIVHIDSQHQQEYWYACPYCPFGCSKHKNNMIRHIRRAHPQKPERQDIGLINQENHFKTRKVKVPVEAGRQGAPPTILQIPNTKIQVLPPMTSRKPTVATATSNAVEAEEDDDELIFVSAQPGKRAPPVGSLIRAPFRSPFGRGNRMVPRTAPGLPRYGAPHRPGLHPGHRPGGPPGTRPFRPGVSSVGGRLGAGSAELDMDCESVEDSQDHDDSVTEDSDYIISTDEGQVINVPGDDSPQDLSAGSSRENTPERSAIRGRGGVLNVPNVRKPPPAHSGSPSLVQGGRTISLEKGSVGGGAGSTAGGKAGTPGLASLEQLTAGIGHMPPPLSKVNVVPSPPLGAGGVGVRASATKPMPPLTHIASGRVSGPPPVNQPPPPRLTPAVVSIRTGAGITPRQAPPLQRAPSPAHSSLQRSSSSVAHTPLGGTSPAHTPLGTRPSVGGRGNPSVAVVQPMPPPTPPTPPEPSSPVDEDEFMSEEEAKRAFSVFNIPRPPTQNTQSQPTAPSTLPPRLVAPPRPVVNQVAPPPEEEEENDFSQFQVRPPGPRGAPRYPTHAAGYGMTPPSNTGTVNSYAAAQQTMVQCTAPGAIPLRPPPPPYATGQPPLSTNPPRGLSGPTHTLTVGTSQFLCPYCPYEGPGSSALKNHILTHQPNIQWICPYCPGPTRMTKTEVTAHIQAVHPACQLVYIPYGVTL